MIQNKYYDEFKQNRLFKGISESKNTIKFNPKNIINKKEGDIIYAKEEESKLVYLILEGEVKLKISGIFSSPIVVKKSQYDFFGEIELFDGTKRKSSVVVNRDCALYPLTKDELNKFSLKNKSSLHAIFQANKYEEPETPKGRSIDYGLRTTTERFDPNAIEEKITNEKEDEQINKKIETKDESLKDLTTDEGTGKEQKETLKKEFVDDPEDYMNWNFSELTEEEDNELKDTDKPEEEFETEDDNKKNEDDELEIEEEVISFKEPPVKSELTEDEFEVRDIPETGEEKDSVISGEKLDLILNATRKINSKIKLEEVIYSIVDASLTLIDADRGNLFYVDRQNNELWTRVITETGIKEIRLKMGESLVGASAKNNEIINLENALEDPRFSIKYDKATGYTTNNILCYPIVNKERKVIAVLQLLNNNSGKFSKEDEETISLIVSNAALSIDNSIFVEKLLFSERFSSLEKAAKFLQQDIKFQVYTINNIAKQLIERSTNDNAKLALSTLIGQANSIIDHLKTTYNFTQNKNEFKTKDLKINEAMKDVLGLLADYVESRNSKLFQKFDTEKVISTDPKALYQACFQIVKNSCDAMIDGGKIYVKVTDNDEEISISIKDDGPEIPNSIRDNIFEPFVTHGKKNAAGMGLAISKKIVKDLSGKIKLIKDTNEFVINFPIVK